jgi:C4-dicarboxylate transporter, DctM subunit
MGATAIAILLFVGMLVLLFLGYPIGFAMGTVVAMGIVVFFDPNLLFQMAQISMQSSTDFVFLVAPLFVLMAEFISISGMADDAYNAARKWLNWLPGGLAISSIFACAVFAALCGSSPVTAATIGMVAIPSMTERGYQKRFAAGVVATAGTLGIMIPPSLCFILYGVMTGTSIGKLFMAGVVPGILMAIFLSLTVIIQVKVNPSVAPQIQEVFSWKERFEALKSIGPILLVVLCVLGSIYTGITTATEAAAAGATCSFVIMLINDFSSVRKLRPALVRSACVNSSIIMVLIGGTCMAFLLTYTGAPQQLIQSVVGLELNRWFIMIGINIVLLILGCLLDPIGILVLTVPLAYPLITALAFDPIWFGVILTLNVEIGMVTPPIGLNLYVLNAVDRSLDVLEIARGATLPLITLLASLAFFMACPEVVLWLPSLMK